MGDYLRFILRVLLVIDYADMRFSNFELEFLRENEKDRETVLL